MLFNSLQFVIFFPIVVVCYFALPLKYRNLLLLVASYYFYMCWKPEYVILIAASTLVDFFAAKKMEQFEERRKRRPYLILSLISNLGMLFAFKYFNFFSESINALCQRFNLFSEMPMFDVLLPVGISFYTFQTLAYSIDVYRGTTKVEHNLFQFALYVSFFPQLVAGPIERSQNLLPQFREKHRFNFAEMESGLHQMVWGFFKKIVIADNLAIAVDHVYSSPENVTGLPLLIATYFFAFQIYCDFSGYSDIAIGAARIMGFRLMENFRRPYMAKGLSEFWGRWHISLSTWFRDYLYIPLGGNRTTASKWCRNLLIVFIVSGLWHGANWTFVVWGAIHGVVIIAEIFVFKKISARSKLFNSSPMKLFLILLNFHVVLVSWVFFRANSLHDALMILNGITKDLVPHLSSILAGGMQASLTYWPLGIEKNSLLMCLGLIGFLMGVEVVIEKGWLQKYKESTWYYGTRLAFSDALVMLMILIGMHDQAQFIYFQF